MTVLCYSSLMRSVSPLNISGNKVKKVTHPIIPYKITLFSKRTNTSRLLYKEFVVAMKKTKQKTNVSVEGKWNRDIGYMHEGTLKDIRLATRNTYLQAFHYRIVQRIISTNTFLFKLGKCETPLCTFCKSVNETLYHILWECEVVQNFRDEVKTCMKDTYNVEIRFTVQSWIFPRVEEESLLNILVITLAKLVIFKSKYKKQLPNIPHFRSLLRFEAEKEEKCARSTLARERFMNEWGNVSKTLSNLPEISAPHAPSQSVAHKASTSTSQNPAPISTQRGAAVVVSCWRPSGGRPVTRPAPVCRRPGLTAVARPVALLSG